MPLGPRLDRPSAIGDEGRPRARSLGIASFVVVAVSLAASATVLSPTVLPALALPVGLVAAGVALLNREGFVRKFVGHFLFMPSACALLATLVVVFVVSPYGFVFIGLVLALLGLSATWADVANRENVQTAFLQSILAYVVMLVATTLLVLLVAGLLVLGGLVTSDLAAGSPALQVLAIVIAVGTAALSVRVALWALPIRQVTPRDRRPTVEPALTLVARLTTLVGLGAVPVAALVGLLTLSGVLSTLFALAGPLAVVVGLVASPVVLWPLFAITGAALAVAGTVWVLRKLTEQFDTWTARWLAAVAAGSVSAVVFPGLVITFSPVGGLFVLLGSVGAALLLLFTYVGPLFVIAIGLTVVVLLYFGVVPDRAGGPAIASAGLVALAVGVGDAAGPPVVVLAAVAGGMVVWDVSTFGLGLTAELGHIPETSRLELFHGVAAVGIGAVAVAGLTVFALAAGWVVPAGAAPAVTVASVGVLVVLAVMR